MTVADPPTRRTIPDPNANNTLLRFMFESTCFTIPERASGNRDPQTAALVKPHQIFIHFKEYLI
jgi:hypothetical protein